MSQNLNLNRNFTILIEHRLVPKWKSYSVHISLHKNSEIDVSCIFLDLTSSSGPIRTGTNLGTHVYSSARLAPYWSARTTISGASMSFRVIARLTVERSIVVRQNDFILRAKIAFMLDSRSRGESSSGAKQMSLMREKWHTRTWRTIYFTASQQIPLYENYNNTQAHSHMSQMNCKI